MGSGLEAFAAMAGYGILHSLLLTAWVREGLEVVLGPRVFRGVFRFVYVLVATVLLVVLVVYLARLPDREWGRLEGPVAWVLWVLRLAALGFIGYCVHRIGSGRFLGLSHWRTWRRGEVPPGPGMETGELVVVGPYRWVRHPMYAAGFVVLWANPHWTANGFGFAIAASLYLWWGALHEEHRLRTSFGDAYRRYAQGTPRFLPSKLRFPPS